MFRRLVGEWGPLPACYIRVGENMGYDAFLAAASAAEMAGLLTGRAVLEVRPLLGLDLLLRFGPRRTPAWAVLSTQPMAACFGGPGEWPGLSAETVAAVPADPGLEALVRLLEVRLEGRAVDRVTVYPWERTVELAFAPRQGLRGDGEPCYLVHEAAPKPAKIVLVRGDRKVAALWPTADGDGVTDGPPRLAHGRTYSPPPAGWTLSPAILAADPRAFAAAIVAAAGESDGWNAEKPKPLWRLLSEIAPPLGPTLAREIARQADKAEPNLPSGSTAQPSPAVVEALYRRFAEAISLYGAGVLEPCLVLPRAGHPVPKDVAAMEIEPGPGFFRLRCESPGLALAAWHCLGRLESGRAGLAAGLERRLRKAVTRAEKKTRRQAGDVAEAGEAADLRRMGELLLAHLYEARPGQTEITVTDYEGGTTAIPLDPRLTPAKNAQRYFDRYRKAQRTADRDRPRQKSLLQLAWLKEAVFDLDRIREGDDRLSAGELPAAGGQRAADGQRAAGEQRAADDRPASVADLWPTAEEAANTLAELRALEAAFGDAGLLPRPGQGAPGTKPRPRASAVRGPGPRPREPFRFTTRDGLVVLAGRSARQNEALSLKMAQPRDIWLHARGCPGSHVLLRLPPGLEAGDVPAASLLEAAALAVHLSAARGGGKVAVDYTEARHLRRPRGAPPGLVLYEPHETVLVNTDLVGLPRETPAPEREG